MNELHIIQHHETTQKLMPPLNSKQFLFALPFNLNNTTTINALSSCVTDHINEYTLFEKGEMQWRKLDWFETCVCVCVLETKHTEKSFV